MDIGRLNKRIIIQRRTATKDDYGQELNTWSDVAAVWANIKPIGGREKLRAMAIESELSHTVAVRYNAALMPPAQADAMRVFYSTPAGDRIFNITASRDVDEARRHIIFDCVEGSLDGQ